MNILFGIAAVIASALFGLAAISLAGSYAQKTKREQDMNERSKEHFYRSEARMWESIKRLNEN